MHKRTRARRRSFTPVHLALQIGLSALPLCALAQHAAAPGNPLDTLPRPAVSPQRGGAADIEKPAAQPEDILAKVIVPRQFDIVGVRSLPFADVAKTFVPLAGKPTPVARIVEFANKITQRYKDQGYALSFAFVPPQDFHDGVVKVVVVEGYIAKVEIEGASGRSEQLLRDMAAPLLAEKPLRSATFDQQTQLMMRLPGVQVSASAQLPQTTDGATTLRLSVKHQPFTVSVGGDIRQPTPRAVVTATVNDPFAGGSQLQLSALLRPVNEERYAAADYTQTLTPRGTALHANLSDYASNTPADALPGVDDRTRQQRAELSLQTPLRLRSNESSIASGGLYATDYSQTYQAAATGNALRTTQNVRALFARLAWSQTTPQTARSATVSLAQGLSGAGARADDSSNYGAAVAPDPARVNFTRITAQAQARTRLTPDGWGAAVSAKGQYSHDVLPMSERISFGGREYGRGYQPGEVAGDSGLGASVEINHAFSAAQPWLTHWEPYLLLETARTWQRQPGVADAHLRSASLGVRLGDGHHYDLDLALSKPLGDPALDNPRRRPRLSLLLSYQFDAR